MLAKVVAVNLLIVWLSICGSSGAGEDEKQRSGRIIGSLKSQKDTADGKNTVIEVLAPGEQKARRYYVLWDSKVNRPIESVLTAVRAAKVGDVVEFEWIGTGHGPAIKSFRLFKKTKDGGKLQELQKERLATLQQLVTVTKTAYLQGTATFAEVAQASAQLLKADLELCESDQERLAAHEKALMLAKHYERIATQRYKAGQGTQASTLSATANRLEAEIALERARAGTAHHGRERDR
jgi:hypothetical protein